MSNFESSIYLLSFLVVELVLFYGFYSRRQGKKAVYTAWYAWIIDLLAIFSGISLMTLSILCIYNSWVFNIQVPTILFVLLFIFGSWQFGIHFVKLIIRNFRMKRVRKEYEHKHHSHNFEKEYNQEVQEYYKNIYK